MSLEAKDLSKVGFQDYFRLRRQLQATGDIPNSQIQQHDNDPITFDEAYDTLNLIVDDLLRASDMYAKVSVDSLGVLITMLVKKGILSKKDYNTILEESQKLMNIDKDDNYDEEH
jgi:hypothetical protein